MQKSDVLPGEIWQAKPPRSVVITSTFKKIKEFASSSGVLITIALNATSCFLNTTNFHYFVKKQSPPLPRSIQNDVFSRDMAVTLSLLDPSDTRVLLAWGV